MLSWIGAIIAIEASTEIIVDSKLFTKFREYMKEINPGFLGELFSCGYCWSVWMSIPMVFVIPHNLFGNDIISIFADYFCKWMILHRSSNIVHEGIKRWLDRAPFIMILQMVKPDSVNNMRNGDNKDGPDRLAVESEDPSDEGEGKTS